MKVTPMGDVYADPDDLTERWRPLTSDETSRADVLLADAAVKIRAACPDVDARIESGDLDPEIPKIVSCDMVRRAMLSPVDQAPMQQMQQTAGPFSHSGTFVNPTGDLYLTKAEKQMLGCGGQRAFTVRLAGTAATTHVPWCSLAFGAGYCSCGADIAGPPLYEG